MWNGSRVGLRRACDAELEYRLTRLEVQVAEKTDRLVNELKDGNHKLQAIELQEEEIRNAIEGLRSEMNNAGGQVWQDEQRDAPSDKLAARIANLEISIKVVLAALRSLTGDVAGIRRNISAILAATGALHDEMTDLPTKRFISQALLDIRHGTYYPPVSHQMTASQQESCQPVNPTDCMDIRNKGTSSSGIYTIQPGYSSKPFMVFCDMEMNDGGWTVIQSRFNGSQDFFLGWADYKTGFGNIGKEFWLGLDHIYELTGHLVNELLIELEDFEGEKRYAQYSAFSIGPENEGFPLKVLGQYRGNAGDSLEYHAGQRFSTKDMDHDVWPEGSCARAHGGAWWYKSCDSSNLNGLYFTGEVPDNFIYKGMYWGTFRGPEYSLKKSRVLIRPRKDARSSATRERGT
ncbi:unnamed protein product [Acanthoscelides obtectus]|nr:unnamed protein product [Acanthoscelides obtectus]CAK1652939.1 Angiopoietin-related protein 2 [Acanthoscelides obtectus]